MMDRWSSHVIKGTSHFLHAQQKAFFVFVFRLPQVRWNI
jgi:hypothetical protein